MQHLEEVKNILSDVLKLSGSERIPSRRIGLCSAAFPNWTPWQLLT